MELLGIFSSKKGADAENVSINYGPTERLKTGREKRAEIEELNEQRERQRIQMLLRDIEKYKPYVTRLINDCDHIPVVLPESGEGSDIKEYIKVNGTEALNIWLKESDYKIGESGYKQLCIDYLF
jgi:hypothetical protein